MAHPSAAFRVIQYNNITNNLWRSSNHVFCDDSDDDVYTDKDDTGEREDDDNQ